VASIAYLQHFSQHLPQQSLQSLQEHPLVQQLLSQHLLQHLVESQQASMPGLAGAAETNAREQTINAR
jgi:hypothetical protein